jgi:aromatic ring-cleaving dioxygenase
VSLNDLIYEIEEQGRRREPEKDRTRPTSAAEMMLAANAGTHVSRPVKAPFAPNAHPIEQVGCWFIDSNFILLDWLKVPAELRPLVVCIAGLSGGDYSDYTPITQTLIGKRLGLHRETVAERLGQLVEWERDEKKALIYIRKNEREEGSHKYQTTEYLPIIVKYAADFIRQLESRGLKPVNKHQAITENTVKLYDNTAKEVIAKMPEAVMGNVLQPRKEKNVTPRQKQVSLLDSRFERVLSAVAEYKNALSSQSYDLQKAWKDMIGKEEEIFFS